MIKKKIAVSLSNLEATEKDPYGPRLNYDQAISIQEHKTFGEWRLFTEAELRDLIAMENKQWDTETLGYKWKISQNELCLPTYIERVYDNGNTSYLGYWTSSEADLGRSWYLVMSPDYIGLARAPYGSYLLVRLVSDIE